MKTFATFAFTIATLFLASCSKPQTAIVGRWHEVGTDAVGVFHEDGTVEFSADGHHASGRYTCITEDKLKIELNRKGTPLGPQVFQFTFSGDKMTWTDIDGKKTEYTRAK